MSLEIAWKQNILVKDSNLLKLLLDVLGFGSQTFICGFSRQNICSVGGSKIAPPKGTLQSRIHLDLMGRRPHFGPCGFNLKILLKNVLYLLQHCVKEQLCEVRHAPMKKCFRLVVPFFEALSSGVNKQLLKIGTYLLYYRLKLRVETFNP